MLQAFGALLLVLDRQGRILDYKAGGAVPASPSFPSSFPVHLKDFAPVEVMQKYRAAVKELDHGGRISKFANSIAADRDSPFGPGSHAPRRNAP